MGVVLPRQAQRVGDGLWPLPNFCWTWSLLWFCGVTGPGSRGLNSAQA